MISICATTYQNLRAGQTIGTKALRFIGTIGGKLPGETPKALEFLKTIDQTSWAGRGFDAGVTLVRKATTVPYQIESMGDSFGTAVAG